MVLSDFPILGDLETFFLKTYVKSLFINLALTLQFFLLSIPSVQFKRANIHTEVRTIPSTQQVIFKYLL